ncbi:MAG: sigma-54 dependent transcriptional regulator [Pseudomonadota bacterium]
MTSKPAFKILVVDDDGSVRSSLVELLEAAGWIVDALDRANLVEPRLANAPPDVILSDVRMPGMSGLELLASLPPHSPPLVLISAHADVPMAVNAMQDGAYSFIEKPYEPRRLLTVLNHAAEQSRMRRSTARLRERLSKLSGLDRVYLGSTRESELLRQELLDLSQTETAVLILGETGTGKELVARALHDLGPNADGPFVALNCAALATDSFEEEMFGRVGGPLGKIAAADGGTLFLDEICTCPIQAQAKLLRAIDEKKVTPLGGTEPLSLSFRVLSSSNEDPDAALVNGRLRRDLLFRLNTVALNLPSLSQRRDDILLLYTHFVTDFSRVYEIEMPQITSEDVMVLVSHDWPGNVRELRNVAERHVLATRRGGGSARQALSSDHFFEEVPATLREAVAALEKELIGKAIQAHQGRMDAVAEALGIGRRTLNEKIVKLGLNKDEIL